MAADDPRPDSNTRVKGMATDEMRRHNLAAVLSRLHVAGSVSRTGLASHTGLNRSTIADLIGELSALGLVEEYSAATQSGPGRPSPIVRTRPDGATALAIELAVDSIAVATVGLGGHVYSRLRVERPREPLTPDEAIDVIADLARPVLGSLPSRHSFLGVAVGVAGIARRSDGFVHLAPNIGWQDVPLGEMLDGRLDVEGPVLVANEADLGALAEHRRGWHPDVAHLIYVSGEVGIGAGLIVDGEPLLGSVSYAGEAGHTLINPAGRRCKCGAAGCWETEAGEAALLRHAGLQASETGLGVLDMVCDRAAAGDEGILAAIAEVGRWLGIGIGNLVNIFNPDVVVLGGLFHRLYPHFKATVEESARTQALTASRENVMIVPSRLGADAPLIGAAELVLSKVITDPAGAPRTRVGE